MKYIFTWAVPLLFISSLGLPSVAFAAATPTLALSATGNGDTVTLTVTGDPNVSVLLSYNQVGSGSQIISLGATDANGSYSTTISSAGYGLTSGVLVSAILNGTSGPRSPSVAWPTVTAANSLTLSPGAVVVSVGSSSSVSAINGGSAALYVSNNSNPSIANVGISGAQITISGNTPGVTTVTLCPVGNTSNCPSVYVTVLASGTSALAFSQSNASVVSGQNLPVTISGGSGVYQVTNNTNASTIQASVSGSVLTLTTGASSGSSSITICSSDMAVCGVVVATAGNASSVAVTFSSSAPTVSVNQSTTVSIYGPAGVQFYVSSNSNPSAVQANLSGTSLTLTGIAAGSSSVNVCATTSTCSTLNVTVLDAPLSVGNIALSQNTASILTGQSIAIIVSGGEQPYFITGGTSAVAQVTLNASSLTVYGIAAGTSTVYVCSKGGGCVSLAITVNGTGTPVAPVVPVPATTIVVPTPLVQVPAAPVVVAAPAFTFTKNLALGTSGSEVTELQKLLAAQGVFSALPNGNYGPQTRAAVKKFQASHGISQLGTVGPSTRAALNQIEAANTSSAGAAHTAIEDMTLSELRAEVQLLQAELTKAQSRISQLTGQ